MINLYEFVNYYYISVNNQAAVTLRGTLILHNAPTNGSARTRPLFLVNTDAGYSGGLFLEGVRYGNFSHVNNLDTLSSENHYVLATGTGNIICTGCSIFAWNNYQYTALGAGANKLNNPGLEGTGSGSIAGWYQSSTWGGSGTHDTITVTSNTAKTGSYSLVMKSAYVSGEEAYRSVLTRPIPVTFGDIVLGGVWIKANFSNGTGHRIFSVRFFDSTGAEVTGSGANYSISDSPMNDWSYAIFGAVVPHGATSVSLQIATGVSSGYVILYADEARLDIIRN